MFFYYINSGKPSLLSLILFMKMIRQVLAAVRRADQTYNLINHGDKIVIGLSGGKDSVVLTYVLSLYQKFSHTDFTIQPVTLDLGFDGFDPSGLKEFCQSLGLNLIVEDSREVYQILLKQKELQKLEHLPCSICSRMKKAAINKVANELGFNKVAFAHHADDAIETLMMNAIYGSRIATFAPKMHLEKANIDFIRPLLLTHEKQIEQLIKEENLPVFGSHCPADKTTTREDIKQMLNDLYHKYPSARENFITMLNNYSQLDIWTNEIYLKVNQKGLCLKPVISPIDEWQMLDIRQKVFKEEQSVPYEEDEIYEEEITATSFLLTINEKPIGTIRYRQNEEGFKIERFAVLKEYRGNGYGKAAFQFLVEMIAAKYNPCKIYFHSQYYIKNLYTKLGFQEEGDFFFEAGIKHIKMFKNY